MNIYWIRLQNIVFLLLLNEKFPIYIDIITIMNIFDNNKYELLKTKKILNIIINIIR